MWLEALPRRSTTDDSPAFSGVAMERQVAATLAIIDPRRGDATAYLAWLHSLNDSSSLDKFLDAVAERLFGYGIRRLIGPTGLSPYIGSGLLQDHWNIIPPLHTPYNPPYLPEVVSNVLRARSSARLFYLPVSAKTGRTVTPPAMLTPLDVSRLPTDLLSLLVAACPPWLDFPSPDAVEAEFLLHRLGPWPTWGWLAEVDAQPVGFILLQPDLSPQLKRAGGGRNPLGWAWLQWAAKRPVRQGRVLFAGVLPDYRRQGIGRQLLHRALVEAIERGWDSLSIGPLPTTAPGARFLARMGAEARQTYILYQRDL